MEDKGRTPIEPHHPRNAEHHPLWENARLGSEEQRTKDTLGLLVEQIRRMSTRTLDCTPRVRPSLTRVAQDELLIAPFFPQRNETALAANLASATAGGGISSNLHANRSSVLESDKRARPMSNRTCSHK